MNQAALKSNTGIFSLSSVAYNPEPPESDHQNEKVRYIQICAVSLRGCPYLAQSPLYRVTFTGNYLYSWYYPDRPHDVIVNAQYNVEPKHKTNITQYILTNVHFYSFQKDSRLQLGYEQDHHCSWCIGLAIFCRPKFTTSLLSVQEMRDAIVLMSISHSPVKSY